MSRLLTAEDLYAIKQIEDPRISPDGSRIAYVLMEMDRDAYEYRRSIWVAPVGGGEPRRFTSGANDVAPRWSPDGRSIAFVRAPAGEVKPTTEEERAAGKGQAQLFVMPTDGGEARQVTHMRYGAGAAEWSPDGTTLLFAAEVGEPDDPEVDDLELHDKHVPRVRSINQLWHKLDGHGWIYEHRSHLFTLPVEGGEPRQITDGDWNDGSAKWSPDGGRIVFTSDRSPDRWRWPADQVWVLDIATGQTTQLADDSLGCSAPSWSPDGEQIAFLATPRRYSDGHTDLYVAPSRGQMSDARMLTRDFTATCEDSCIDDMRAHGTITLTWSADGQEVYFLAAMRGTTHLYALRPNGDGQPRRVTEGNIHVCGFSLDRATRTAALGISTPTQPGDLYAQSVEGGATSEARRLTEVNAELFAELELATPEEFSFTGADGWELQGWILRPTEAGSGETVMTPGVLQVHGGPHAMYGYSFFFEFQLLVAHGYTVVYSNPRGSTGYGRTFSGAVANDWGGKDYEDVIAGLDAAIARGGIDEGQLGIAGGSYGGFMTNWAIGHTDRFKGAVTMRSVVNMNSFFGTSDAGWWLDVDELGATPWEDRERLARFSPFTYVEQMHTPLLILHSDNDLRCPIAEGQQLFTALKYLDRETKFVVFEGQTHDLSRNGHPRSRVRRLNEILGWFQKYVPVGQP